MPGLTKKLFFSTLAISFALIATSRASADEPLTIKATISKNLSLPLQDTQLAPGNEFDEKLATELMGNTKFGNEWHKIPYWMGNSWQVARRELGIIHFQDCYLRPEFRRTGHHVPSPIDIDLARYVDSSSQRWEYNYPGYWVHAEEEGFLHHCFLHPIETTILEDEVFGTIEVTTDFLVKKDTGKIADVTQIVTELTRYATPPNAFASPRTMHVINHGKIYDWQGNLRRATESKAVSVSIGTSVPNTAILLPDGRNLYQMFEEFLKDKGLTASTSSANGQAYQVRKIEN